MEVFGFSNYRDYLSFRIESDEEGRGYQKKLATAAGCQSSYLSQVLSTQANLTLEQAIGLSGFWNFDEDETEFFMKLVQYDRAGTPRLREHVLTKMEELRAKHRTLSNRFQDVTSITDGIELEYYSTWYLPVIHTMVAVPEFRHAKAIARQLNLDVAVIENALETLARADLVEKMDYGWTNTARSIHLKSESPLNYTYHKNIREIAGRTMQQGNPGENIHYSAIYSLSKSDFDRIKQQLVAMLDESRSVIIKSKEETAAIFALDFFQV